MGKAGAHAARNRNREIGVGLQHAQIVHIGHVFRQIQLPGLKRHRFCRRIAHVQQLNRIIRHIPAPIGFICNHGVADFLPEVGGNIGSGANRSMVVIGGMRRVQNHHYRISKILRQVDVRPGRSDRHIPRSIVRDDFRARFQVILRGRGAALASLEQPFQAGLHRFGGQLAAVGKFHAVPDVEHPLGMPVVDGVCIAQRVHNIHGIVKLEQALAYAVARDVPCTIDLPCGVKPAAAVVLNAKGHAAAAGGVPVGFVRLLIHFALTAPRRGVLSGPGSPRAAAASHDAGKQQPGQQ